jgi:hypothetical protein
LICGSDDDALVVLTNNGAGGFALGSNIPLNADFWPQSVIAADLNGRGKPDLICVNFNDFYIPGTLTLLRNNGFGAFTNSTTFAVGEGPYCVVGADLNGDGKLDLVTANHMDYTLSVLIQVPTLDILASTNAVTVSWPSSWTNWSLLQASTLGNGSWSPVDKGVTDDGTNKSLVINTLKDSGFLRLSHP